MRLPLLAESEARVATASECSERIRCRYEETASERVARQSSGTAGQNPDQQHANASDNYLKCDAEKWRIHVAIANPAFFGDRLRPSLVEDGDAMREAPNRFKLPRNRRQ